jgi:hypothetical protein
MPINIIHVGVFNSAEIEEKIKVDEFWTPSNKGMSTTRKKEPDLVSRCCIPLVAILLERS